MTEGCGACAQQKEDKTNGITVKADKDFGAIELAFHVEGRKIGCFLSAFEAEALSEALKGEICVMLGDDTKGGRCSPEELEEIVKRNKANEKGTETTDEGKDQEA